MTSIIKAFSEIFSTYPFLKDILSIVFVLTSILSIIRIVGYILTLPSSEAKCDSNTITYQLNGEDFKL